MAEVYLHNMNPMEQFRWEICGLEREYPLEKHNYDARILILASWSSWILAMIDETHVATNRRAKNWCRKFYCAARQICNWDLLDRKGMPERMLQVCVAFHRCKGLV